MSAFLSGNFLRDAPTTTGAPLNPGNQTIGVSVQLIMLAGAGVVVLTLLFLLVTSCIMRGESQTAKILRMTKPERRLLTCATFCMLTGTFCSMPTNLLFGQFIDLVTLHLHQSGEEAVKKEIPIMFAWMLSTLFGNTLFSTLSSAMFSLSGERLTRRMRASMFKRLIVQETAFFDAHQSGEWTNRLAADAQTVQSAATSNVSMFLNYTTTFAVSVLFCLYTSWQLFCVILVLLPVMFTMGKLLGSRMSVLSKEYQDCLAKSGATAGETLQCMRTIRTFAAGEERELSRYEENLDKAYFVGVRRAFVNGGYSFVLGLVAQMSIIGSLWVGTYLVVEGILPLGSLTAFLMYGMQASMAVSQLVNLFSSMSSAIGASKKIFEIIEREPLLPSTLCESVSSLLVPLECHGNIAFEDVYFAYSKAVPLQDAPPPTARGPNGELNAPLLDNGSPSVASSVPTQDGTQMLLTREVLKGITFIGTAGSVMALVGPSGGGKSTIVSLLLRLYDPRSGTVRLDGNDLKDIDPRWLKRQVAAVTQEPVLFSRSIRENITYGIKEEVSQEEVERAAQMANAHGFISELQDGYNAGCGERGVRLSGGQKQRIAIARALVLQPRLLLLDEATSALDAESEHQVQLALDSIIQGGSGSSKKPTVVIVAHRLSTVQCADKVLVIDGGKVVEEGTHSELLQIQDGLYAKLATRQLLGAEENVQDKDLLINTSKPTE